MCGDELSPPTISDNVSVISDIEQLDGNASVSSDQDNYSNYCSTPTTTMYRKNIASVAHHLPVVTVCNLRSFFPKLESFKTDFF